MYLAYDILLHLALAVSMPYLLFRGATERQFRQLCRERLGRLPDSANPYGMTGIWVQAVSVGEVMLAKTLLSAIRAAKPDIRFYLSTTTPTGRDMAERTLADSTEALLYFPADLPFAVRRTLDRLRPALFIALETEIWPNLLRSLARREVPAVIVNGRISPDAFARYRRARFFFRRVLRNLDLALMQTEEDAERLVYMGMSPERVAVTGNLKFDTPPPRDDGSELAAAIGIEPEETVFLAGSTVEGEEMQVLDAYRAASRSCGRPVLVLAPRHPDRFDTVARELETSGVRFARRSQMERATAGDREVLLLDSLGELPRLYGRARVVFVGGSLVPRGGHNILEPAACGKPVLFGPHMENFRDIAGQMLAGGGGLQVRDREHLAEMMERVARDDDLFARAGAAARAVVETNRGALKRTLELLEPYLGRFGPVSC